MSERESQRDAVLAAETAVPQDTEPLKLVICVTERGKFRTVRRVCDRWDILFSLLCYGRGTADSWMLNLLGLGDTEKDVALFAVRRSAAPGLMQDLTGALGLKTPGNGIAVTVPLASVADRRTLQLLCGLSRPEAVSIREHAEELAELAEEQTSGGSESKENEEVQPDGQARL